jgi:hypothetical protein
MPAIEGKADIALISDNVPFSSSGLLPCKLDPESHFTDPKSLLQLFLIAACRDTQENE